LQRRLNKIPKLRGTSSSKELFHQQTHFGTPYFPFTSTVRIMLDIMLDSWVNSVVLDQTAWA